MLIGQSLIETLESRRLLSGASFVNGVVRVRGDENNNNEISVANSADGTNLDVTIKWTTANHVSKTFNASFPKSLGLKKLNITGGKRADTITVGILNGSIGLNTRIESRRGDDTINLFDERDVVYAGGGNDTV